jgi:hypothetical protein
MTMKKSSFLRLVMAVALLLTVNTNALGDNLRLGGSIVGKIESNGDVRIGGSIVGRFEANGDIRKNGSIIGRAEQMTDVRRVAVMYFFPFFNLR